MYLCVVLQRMGQKPEKMEGESPVAYNKYTYPLRRSHRVTISFRKGPPVKWIILSYTKCQPDKINQPGGFYK